MIEGVNKISEGGGWHYLIYFSNFLSCEWFSWRHRWAKRERKERNTRKKSSLTSNVERKKKRSESSLQGQRVYVTNQIKQ